MVRPRVVTAELRHEAALELARGRQKLALGLLVCLPVPLLAMSGLAVPLPSAVYRAAVAIVENTEGLARALTGTKQEARVLAVRRATSPLKPTPRRPGSSREVVEGAVAHRSSVRVPPAAETRTRSFQPAPRKRSRASQPSHRKAVRTPSAPAPDERSEAAPPAAAPTATPAPPQAPAQEMTKARSPVEPTPRPVDNAQTEPAPSKPPVSPSPPPPPAPTPEPGLLDPVTKPLEPVTKSLDPVTKPLEPVTDTLEPITRPLEPVTGRLGILNP
jgi:hypothetical protein